jgi:hypothetical protein
VLSPRIWLTQVVIWTHCSQLIHFTDLTYTQKSFFPLPNLQLHQHTTRGPPHSRRLAPATWAVVCWLCDTAFIALVKHNVVGFPPFLFASLGECELHVQEVAHEHQSTVTRHHPQAIASGSLSDMNISFCHRLFPPSQFGSCLVLSWIECRIVSLLTSL